jgi:hypothetical protein
MSGVTDREGAERKGDTFFRYGFVQSHSKAPGELLHQHGTLEHLVDKDLPSSTRGVTFFAWKAVKLTAWSPNFPQSGPS